MSNEFLLLFAVLVFSLMSLGLLFTALEFKRLRKEELSNKDK
jgi:hypothetical protein